jgi:hypothetical protein
MACDNEPEKTREYQKSFHLGTIWDGYVIVGKSHKYRGKFRTPNTLLSQ